MGKRILEFIAAIAIVATLTAAMRPRGPITLHLEDAELTYALGEIGRQLQEVDIHNDPPGRVTLHLENATLEQAMGSIIEQHPQYTYKLDEHIFFGTPEELEEMSKEMWCIKLAAVPDNAISRGYICKIAPADRVVDFLSGQFDRVQFTLREGNAFIALGSPKDLAKISEEFPHLDRPPGRATLESNSEDGGAGR